MAQLFGSRAAARLCRVGAVPGASLAMASRPPGLFFGVVIAAARGVAEVVFASDIAGLCNLPCPVIRLGLADRAFSKMKVYPSNLFEKQFCHFEYGKSRIL